MTDLYDRDYYAWANEQATLVRSRSTNAVDWDNIAEELESLGKQQRSELLSRYEVLLVHLLKWLYQPQKRSRSWRLTITTQRDRILEHLESSPSLKSSDDEIFARAYWRARRDAAAETGLKLETFPETAPFTSDQSRDVEFWPDAAD